MTNKGDLLLIPDDAQIEQLDVKLHNRQQVNSIQELYPDFRQRSKAP